jgi:hypothetical protein
MKNDPTYAFGNEVAGILLDLNDLEGRSASLERANRKVVVGEHDPIPICLAANDLLLNGPQELRKMVLDRAHSLCFEQLPRSLRRCRERFGVRDFFPVPLREPPIHRSFRPTLPIRCNFASAKLNSLSSCDRSRADVGEKMVADQAHPPACERRR